SSAVIVDESALPLASALQFVAWFIIVYSALMAYGILCASVFLLRKRVAQVTLESTQIVTDCFNANTAAAINTAVNTAAAVTSHRPPREPTVTATHAATSLEMIVHKRRYLRSLIRGVFRSVRIWVSFIFLAILIAI